MEVSEKENSLSLYMYTHCLVTQIYLEKLFELVRKWVQASDYVSYVLYESFKNAAISDRPFW